MTVENEATWSATPNRTGRTLEWTVTGALVALILVAWMLRHGYEGIIHDAQLYSFQAMARIKPALLGNDLYLRFGSQDNYTLFSPLYAAAIARFGFEPAAALLTFISQAVFIVAAWILARRVMPRDFAWLGVGLLLAVPSVYGAIGVWSFMEGFVTPRLLCETFILAALTATLAGRHWLACACLIAGALLHPLMAAAGIAMVIYIRLMPLRPAVIARLLLVAAALAAVSVAVVLATSSLRLEGEWLALVRERQGFLFITQWRPEDWARTAVHFTTLIVGFIVLPRESMPRLLCSASVVVALTGLLMSLIGGDFLNMELIIQGQPWRWAWLAAVLSALLAPTIASHGWQRGHLGKLAIVLVVVAWLAIDEPYTIIVAPLAIGAAAAAKWGWLPAERAQRAMLAGGFLVFALVVVRSLANSVLGEEGMPDHTPVPEIVRHLRAYSRDGLLPCMAIVGVWWLLTSNRSRMARTAVAAACAIGCAALVPASASEWKQVEFPQRDFDAFASWRKRIPPGEEVLWIDGGVATWALLERPRYLTNNQMASILFSKGARAELRRRALRLAPIAGDSPYLFWNEDRKLVRKGVVETLATLCPAIDARFIVTRRELAPAPLEDTPPGTSLAYRGLKLYQCER
jgi:hypothetical protein